jgi:acyl-ACP thioesterase
MNAVYESTTLIVPSLADHNGLLSIPGAFRLFQDIASAHSEELRAGYGDLLKRDLFWLTVKTKLVFRERPKMGQAITLRTWPEAPGKLRCCRSYELECGGEVLVTGRTEWAIMNFVQQRLHSPQDIYPEGFVFREGAAVQESFARIPEHFDGFEPYATYTVPSTDIDIGNHMNNVAYVTALAGSFSTEEWDRLPKHTVDVLFRASCFEGEALEFRKKETEGGVQVRLSRGDETVLLAALA